MLNGKIPYQNNLAIYTHIWKTYMLIKVNGGTIIINDTMKAYSCNHHKLLDYDFE